MRYPDLLSLLPRIRSSQAVLIDLDGTLVSGGRLYPDTGQFLASLDRPFMILSNDSEHTAGQLSDAFCRFGVRLHASQFVLAGVALIEDLAQRRPKESAMVLGSRALQDLARAKGLDLTDDQPDTVIVMRDRGFNYQRLEAAARALHRGARLIAACLDRSHPGPSGEPIPETGALVAAISACVGLDEYSVFGKPESTMFKLAAQRLGVAPSACAMIGDNPETDGVGSRRLGMIFYQISRKKTDDATLEQTT